jgi:hypothetical protein
MENANNAHNNIKLLMVPPPPDDRNATLTTKNLYWQWKNYVE